MSAVRRKEAMIRQEDILTAGREIMSRAAIDIPLDYKDVIRKMFDYE